MSSEWYPPEMSQHAGRVRDEDVCSADGIDSRICAGRLVAHAASLSTVIGSQRIVALPVPVRLKTDVNCQGAVGRRPYDRATVHTNRAGNGFERN